MTKTTKTKTPKTQRPHNEKPISLYPLSFEEALRALHQTPPLHKKPKARKPKNTTKTDKKQ